MARGERRRERELDAEIERLYGRPLGEFTAARNALAARLKKEGQTGASDHVKSLAKPTPSAWAVNMLLRSERDAVKALLAAGERALAAQSGVAGGKAAPAELRAALEEQRQRRDDLKRRAAGLLTESGRKPTATQLERLTDDLDALALDPAAEPVRRRGWLDADLDPPGFEVLAGLQLAAGASHGLRLVRGGAGGAAAGKPGTARAARPAADRSREERRTSSARSAGRREAPEPAGRTSREDEARRKWQEAARARREREEERHRQRIARAEERLERAREEAQGLGAEAARLARAADEAEKAAAAARREAERARERSDRAAERLERAREELAGERAARPARDGNRGGEG